MKALIRPLAILVAAGLIARGAWWGYDQAYFQATEPGSEVGQNAESEREPRLFPLSDDQGARALPREAVLLDDTDGAARLVAVIRDATELPLPAVRVTLQAESPAAGGDTLLTDAAGEAIFEGLRSGSYDYKIETPERPVLSSLAPIELVDGESKVLEIALADYLSSIRGRVVDQDGTPVQGLEVRARSFRSPLEGGLRPESASTVLTGADGKFELTQLRHGEYDVGTLADERYHTARVMARAGADSVLLMVAKLVGGVFNLSGKIMNPSGEPIGDVRVLPLGQPGRHTVSDDAGRYSLSLADHGRSSLDVRFLRAGYQAGRLTLGPLESNSTIGLERDLVLEPLDFTVAVSGHLRDDRGTPVPGEVLYLESRTLGTRYRAQSESTGLFIFPQVATGSKYRIWTRPRGPYAAYAQDQIDPGQTMLDIALTPLTTGTLAGRVVDTEGIAVPYHTLRLRSAHAPGKLKELLTDSQGQFHIQGVPAGPVTVEARSEPRFRLADVDVKPDSERYVELVLDLGRDVLEGRVVGTHGYALAGASVKLSSELANSNPSGQSTRTTITNEHGEFQFTQLGRASRYLEVKVQGYSSRILPVQSRQQWVEIVMSTVGEALSRTARIDTTSP